MVDKGKEVTFLEDDIWLNDLSFLEDITKYLADLNLKLHGKKQFVNKMFEYISAFIFLNLLKEQLAQQKVMHFPCLSTRRVTTVD